MNIKVLTENTSISDEFKFEHGLSLYIETEDKNILFDSGKTGMFFDNAKQLGVDISQVDVVVISHGHYDHTGGLKTFLENNSKAPIYINENAFLDYYAEDGRYIGVDKSLIDNDRIVLVSDEYEIDKNLKLYTMNKKERPYKTQSKGLLLRTENGEKEDTYIHEQYLVITENGKNTLISGCSHKGILNIVEFFDEFDIKTFIGGFHLMNISVDECGIIELDKIADKLLKYKTMYYTGHCTGVEQYNYLKSKMAEKLDYIPAGKSFSV